MQPGSSCVTSLIEAESIPKHVALLEITGTEFHVTPIPIQHVSLSFPIPFLLDATFHFPNLLSERFPQSRCGVAHRR